MNDVSKPKLRTEDGSEIKLRIFTRRDALEQAEFASSIGLPILYFFENYFNVSYPLPKQDMVALPDMSAAAMENWGLITYRSPIFFFCTYRCFEGLVDPI
jgi:aminopeptidase N